ncbi:MAG: P4 alpha zinc-binding domain protein [Gammaproteobacteria bacterium]|nr:P4 alpha zinc-binding domain protein [Gammaproteobacteria bacterium]
MRSEVAAAAQGRWPQIHSAAGIPPGFLRNRHQPCPMCGGRDRYRYDDKDGRGSYYCNQCGAGDGFALLMQYHGWDFEKAAAEVSSILGHNPAPTVTPKPAPRSTAQYAEKLWQAALADDAAVAAHPYAIRKRITHAAAAARGRASGKLIGRDADCVIVPQRTLAGDLVGVECIDCEGVKQSFGRKGVLILGNDLDAKLPQLIVEGWATAVAILGFYHWNACVYAAFGRGKLEPLACELAAKYPDRTVIIGGERDA